MMSIGIPTRALRTTSLEAMVEFLALFRERGAISIRVYSIQVDVTASGCDRCDYVVALLWKKTYKSTLLYCTDAIL